MDTTAAELESPEVSNTPKDAVGKLMQSAVAQLREALGTQADVYIQAVGEEHTRIYSEASSWVPSTQAALALLTEIAAEYVEDMNARIVHAGSPIPHANPILGIAISLVAFSKNDRMALLQLIKLIAEYSLGVSKNLEAVKASSH